jgi:hypothetical protein
MSLHGNGDYCSSSVRFVTVMSIYRNTIRVEITKLAILQEAAA